MTTPFSARLPERTIHDLREQARRERISQTALAERYIDEGLRMDRHPLIVFRDGGAGRRPALAGTRLDVWQVVETIRQNDNSPAEAAEYLGLAPAQIDACTAYYADYRDEIDAWIAAERDEADRLEENWRRRQELFS
jgi:uncharacterized protein (DUF433 family)